MIAKRPWGQPVEVPDSEFPAKQGYNPLLPLLRDVALHLERTPKGSLCVPFDSEAAARQAARAMPRLALVYVGKEHIVFARGRRPDGTHALYVRRGPNWGRNGKAEQEVERREQEKSQ